MLEPSVLRTRVRSCAARRFPAATVRGRAADAGRLLRRPSFRWSPTRDAEPAAAAVDRRVGHPHDRDWAALAPTKPAVACERRRPGVQAHRSRRARLPVGPVRPARDDQHHRHAEVGERRQVAEHDAEEARRLHDVRRMLATRYNGRTRARIGRRSGRSGTSRTCSSSSRRSSSGKKIVGPANYAKLFKAAYAGIKSGNPRRRSRSARHRPGPRQAAQGCQRHVSPGTFAQLARKGEGAEVRRLGASSVPDVADLQPLRRCATRT